MEASGNLLPNSPPIRVHPKHREEIPGSEQAHAVDWLRLPHWELVKHLQDGDQEALGWIMDTYREPLLRYAKRILVGSADPEDVVKRPSSASGLVGPPSEPRVPFGLSSSSVCEALPATSSGNGVGDAGAAFMPP